jgi:hypothetical protein
MITPSPLCAPIYRAAVGLLLVTVTPEAVVYDARGRMVYRGRIDDRYPSIGVERPSPSQHDLQEVLTTIVGGRAPVSRTTKAVGCFILDTIQ